MTFEIAQIIKSKQAYRAQLATRPIAEKLRILEELRKRTLAIAASRRNEYGVTAVEKSLFTQSSQLARALSS